MAPWPRYASQLIQAGAPLIVVSEQLGHRNTDSVGRTYGHMAPQIRQAEVWYRFASLEDIPNEPVLNPSQPRYAYLCRLPLVMWIREPMSSKVPVPFDFSAWRPRNSPRPVAGEVGGDALADESLQRRGPPARRV